MCVCWRMLTYADVRAGQQQIDERREMCVCWRMLTYADVRAGQQQIDERREMYVFFCNYLIHTNIHIHRSFFSLLLSRTQFLRGTQTKKQAQKHWQAEVQNSKFFFERWTNWRVSFVLLFLGREEELGIIHINIGIQASSSFRSWRRTLFILTLASRQFSSK